MEGKMFGRNLVSCMLFVYSLILARSSWSRKRVYSSSPILMGLPPYCEMLVSRDQMSLLSFKSSFSPQQLPIRPTISSSSPSSLPSSLCLSSHPTTYLRNQNLIASLHARSNALAILIEGTGANSQNLGLVGVLDGRLGEEDATSGLGLGLYALDEDAVQEGGDGADGLEERLFLLLALHSSSHALIATIRRRWSSMQCAGSRAFAYRKLAGISKGVSVPL